jgi:hypothetical protein
MGLEASASDLRVGFAGCKIALLRSQLLNYPFYETITFDDLVKISKMSHCERSEAISYFLTH